MHGLDDDEDDLPPKRGAPPTFRRNRAAAAVTLCGLAFLAGMGVQWGLHKRVPSGPPPDASEPSRPPVRSRPPTTGPEDHPVRPPMQVVSAAVAPSAAATPQAAPPPPEAAPSAATVGLSRRALAYGQGPRPAPPSEAAPQPPPPAVQAESELARRAAAPPAAAPTEPAVARATAGAPAPTRPRPVRPTAVSPRPQDAGPPPRPSFDCARASTPGERMVCRDPRLAVLDRRMDAAFRRALAGARDPRGLKADQDRWIAVREGAALRDPSMVGPAYERRIAELAEARW